MSDNIFTRSSLENTDIQTLPLYILNTLVSTTLLIFKTIKGLMQKKYALLDNELCYTYNECFDLDKGACVT
ncbi:hypothetical protein NLV77_001077 [Staphylococcus ureilyticus]|nr:hypothetical protein [Staphylococcus ureilyticus]